MAIQNFSPLQLNSTLTVGVDDTGYDVTFFGDASGEKMLWDTSAANLTIYHTDEEAGLRVFTNGGAQTTKPQLLVGRGVGEYWGVYTEDRNAYLVHRQDETSGTMTTRFDQWDSNTSDTTGNWVWRVGNGAGGSMSERMILDQAGNLEIKGTLKMPNSQTLTATTGNINFSGSATFAGNIALTGGGTIEAPSVNGSETLNLIAAGGINLEIDSNGNSGDDQFFKIYKHSIGGTALFSVKETGDATFAGNITTGGHVYLPVNKYIYSNNKGLIGATANQTEIYGVSNKISFYAEGGGSQYMIINAGNVGIATTSPLTKLDVNGAIIAGGKLNYTKVYGSLNTTGNAVAGLIAFAGGNGASGTFIFNCGGGGECYQKIIYSVHNVSGTWNFAKVIDEGTNHYDITAAISAVTGVVTFTFKTRSGSKSFSPTVNVEFIGSNTTNSINLTYA